MYNLNSILIEGTLTADPVAIEGGCSFQILSVSKRQESRFTVNVFGRLGENTLDYLKGGRGVRVVGLLEEREGGVVIINAEHVEYRAGMKTNAA